MGITAIPLFFLAANGLKDFGDFSDVTNTRQIREMTDTYLTAMAREKARKFDQFFSSSICGPESTRGLPAYGYQRIFAHRTASHDPKPQKQYFLYP